MVLAQDLGRGVPLDIVKITHDQFIFCYSAEMGRFMNHRTICEIRRKGVICQIAAIHHYTYANLR